MTSRIHKLSGCHRHPSQPITGFCASCLRERLEGIESSSSPHRDHPTNANNSNGHDCPSQLRRTKSCSGRDPLTASEPRRRSCEVRVKNTLSDLFNVDDERKGLKGSLDLEVRNVDFEIRADELDEGDAGRVSEIVVDEGQKDEICEEDTLTMKEFIDLELQSRKSNAGKDFKEIAGSLWEVTSTFTKRLKKWGRKHNLKKNADGENGGLMGLKGVKISIRGLRESRSKIGEHVSGRRSCDTDPRLSNDAGRMSVDDSRFSFDEPRASWDGYLIGKACHPRLVPLVSVVEDVKSPPICENRTLVEGKEQCPTNLSMERRRRSLDCSSSTIKQAISEADELKLISNSKVSPATTELFCGAKLLITEKELMEKNFASVGNAQSGCSRDNRTKGASDIGVGTCEKGSKKSQKWRGVLSMLGMVQQKTEGVVEYKEASVSENIDKLSAESRLANGEIRLISHQIIRSSSVNCRDPRSITELCNNFHSSEAKGNSVKEKQDITVQGSLSSKYSPHALDNGLLRFYLTPSRSYRRSKSRKSWLKVLNPTGRNVL